MAIDKSKAAKKKRSVAAKKAWATRRKNELKLKLKRSEAAKKAWVTRRKNAR